MAERHGAAGEREGVGEKFAEFGVGAALLRGRVNLDLQRLAEPAHDGVSRGVREGFDRERTGGERCGHST